MAKKRRSYKISSGDYNVAGGGGTTAATTSAGGFVKIAKGHPNKTNNDHDGFVNPSSTVNVMIDVGVSIPTKDQYFYIDNAFESAAGQVTVEYISPTTALPSGINWSQNQDSIDQDQGEARFYGTPNTGTEGTYTMKVNIDYPYGRTDEQTEFTYVLKVVPAGTTPIFPTSMGDQIIRNTTGEQTLLAATTTSYADAKYTMSNVSGFNSAVTPTIDENTGRVYLTNVGDITAAATQHSLTITVDLGPYGTQSKTYTRDIKYGDPYGARYFGPNNASFYPQGNDDRSSTQQQTDNACNPLKSSGALRRVHNANEDTSPYLYNDGYGCEWGSNYSLNYTNQTYYDDMSGYGKYGYMGFTAENTQWWCSGSNYREVKFRWTVPSGVTSFCAVAVGGGAGGAYNWAADAGGAGGLAWMNGISCSPGDVYYVYVGLGRESESNVSSYGAGSSFIVNPSGQTVIFAEGGGYTGYQTSNPNGQRTWYDHAPTGLNYWEKGGGYGGNDSRDGGGFAVNTALGSSVNGFHYGGGAAYYAGGSRVGMGAAGYRGNQDRAGSSDRGVKGGGGCGYSYSSTYGQGGGGGVGLDGQGWRGVDGNSSRPRSDTNAGSGFGGSSGSWSSYNNSSANYYGGGGGGSGGTRGAWGENQFTGREERSAGHRSRVGGTHGGGGGGSGTSVGGGNGAPGGVRIIWGAGEDGTPRSFPHTYCSEKPSMKYNGEA